MYFWNTNALAEDIKNDVLSDNDWKQYYLAGSILMTLSMYLVSLSPRTNILSTLVEAIGIIGIIIFGVQVTFNTEQKGNRNDIGYIPKMVALSFPILIKLFVLSFSIGLIYGVFIEIQALSLDVQAWINTVFSIIIEIMVFWRINIHLHSINT